MGVTISLRPYVHSTIQYPNSVELLMSKVTNSIDDLKVFVDTEHPTKEKLQHQEQLKIDARLSHILAIAGPHRKDHASKHDQLRRGLATYSLASEYQTWLFERTGSKSARGRPSSKSTSKARKLDDYLEANEYRFGKHHEKSLKYSLRLGTALLAMVKALKGTGYLAVLIFRTTGSERTVLLKQDKTELADALRSNDEVRRFAESSQVKEWVESWRREYDSSTGDTPNNQNPQMTANAADSSPASEAPYSAAKNTADICVHPVNELTSGHQQGFSGWTGADSPMPFVVNSTTVGGVLSPAEEEQEFSGLNTLTKERYPDFCASYMEPSSLALNFPSHECDDMPNDCNDPASNNIQNPYASNNTLEDVDGSNTTTRYALEPDYFPPRHNFFDQQILQATTS
ncbi:MAG: hypothetical protein Q9168_003973 [Polycauliona sp. 1 TL-2023]